MAILAQSVGGGGGVGGFAVGGTASRLNAASDTVGGSGGAGGEGGDITLTNASTGEILTEGAFAYGVQAQSIGGGGGNGGFAASGTLALDGDAASSIGAGSGAGGGRGGAISLSNDGLIQTGGAGAIALFAQSVGGGGGAGGFAGGLTGSGDSAFSSTIGGAGGDASVGGDIVVSNTGQIHAAGDNSAGIFAQSVGGGGGAGGFSLAASGGMSSLSISLGGSGGAGGDGGAIRVTNAADATIVADGLLSYGVFAQSVGGGGGKGGFAVDGSLAAAGSVSSNLGAGSGAGGGDGGRIDTDNGGNVLANGAGSVAVFAQSIGGGGGAGGFAGGLSVGQGGAIAQSVGGAGAGGGIGGDITLANSGIIQTLDANSMGVFAQSVGGGGGLGGFSIAGSATSGSGTSTSLGGSGGAGGDGGTIAISNSGVVNTKGDLSYGVFAQSIGGGGGVAGMAVSGTLSSGLDGLTSAIGGTGGAGGDGGAITVTNSGDIIVEGAASVGILAQSIGGGGGAGGFSGALSVSGGTLGNQVGGQGGGGGDGGDVTVTSTGSIVTLQDDSVAVLAQSIAGGGGQSAFAISAQVGAFDFVNLGLGAHGDGISGKQGKVVVNLLGGTIQSAGALSYGVLAQAIGAGGGNAAISVPDPLEVGAGGLALQLGSTGGVAGDGNVVDVTNANEILTLGAGAVGFSAQSIGGGGGMEGVTGDVHLGAGDGLWSTTVGGSSTSSGSGQAVTIANTAAIVTQGDNAIGLLAQSVGGGGGNGSMSLGLTEGSLYGLNLNVGGSQTTASNGGDIEFTTSTGGIETAGNLASGLVVQSIGGGGGVAGFTSIDGADIGEGGIRLSAGATGGAGGDGGNISLTQKANIVTSGAGANAVLIQSIGGGGGYAGIDNSGQAATVNGLRLGGGANGSGGAIDFTLDAGVQTSGAGAVGVAVQSIGGGGGMLTSIGSSVDAPLEVGTTGGATGDGGAVKVATNGVIQTSGAGSTALIVQSIGGGGGSAVAVDATGAVQQPNVVQASSAPAARTFSTFSTFASLAAPAGVGDGGAVDVTIGAAIHATGDQANGVVVQSIGGGGTSGGSLAGAGAGGELHLTVNADVTASGAGATALVAASSGGNGAAPIIVDIGAVEVVGGIGGHALSLLGGTDNSVTNAGTLATQDGQDGMVIYAQGGNNSITNSGLIVGSIDLGAGNNSFTNTEGGIFLAGPIVNMGTGTFTNSGIINPGGAGVIANLNVSGGLSMTSTSVYNVDLDFKTGTADKVIVSGGASLAGTLTTNLLNLGYAQAGHHGLVVMDAAAGITGQDSISLIAPNSAVATFSLGYPSAQEQSLDYVIEFSPEGLNARQARIGRVLNRIQMTPTAAFAPTAAAIIAIPTVSALGTIYQSLTGEGTTAAQSATLSAVSNSHDIVESQIGTRVGSYAAAYRPEPTGKLWLAMKAGRQRLDGTDGAFDMRSNGFDIQGGWDYRPNARTVVGATFGYDRERFAVAGVDTSGKAQVYTGGVYGGINPGVWTISASLLYSAADTSHTRFMTVPGAGSVNAYGDYSMHAWSSRAQVGYRIGLGDVQFQPFGALEATRLSLPAYHETSATSDGEPGALSLAFDAKRMTRTRSFLGTDVAGRISLSGSSELITTLRGTWIHDFDTSRSVIASFANAPVEKFETFGAPAVKDSGRFDLRTTLRNRNFDFQVGGSATVGAGYSDVSVQAGIRIRM
ncbi:autotransporter outer membrane beta-barrel domain-containing protein [Sphingobium baderi]|uniref:autotransporter outer membrane beta-barrel domain-containing protein n=1 Tax=Sphingobium baderi TaxID=1332080 RepID=UPI0012683574|nr:autotransporter outer membrane beta-barrel domain-containing protein [Sphingobium baderi]